MCQIYTQKTEQYTNAKKQLTIWAKQIDDRNVPTSRRHIVYQLTQPNSSPYDLLDKSMLLSISQPVSQYTQVIGVFQCYLNAS